MVNDATEAGGIPSIEEHIFPLSDSNVPDYISTALTQG